MNAFVKISIILAITAQALTSCVSKTTCWKIINEGKCVPISTYKEWNKCVVGCEITLQPKTKPYKPKEWKATEILEKNEKERTKNKINKVVT